MLPPWRRHQNSPERSIPIQLSFLSLQTFSGPEEIERVIAVTFDKFDAKLDALVNNASKLGMILMLPLIDYQHEQLSECFK